uniref:Chromosome 16 open reading frame 89 n=1 Tax=Oncorhynchus tshawytscha TaxID=74940 RepID=A0AAZ3NNY3_ONCTS
LFLLHFLYPLNNNFIFSNSTTGRLECVIDVILASLAKSASFLEQEHRNINLDGVVGYIILQAELKEAVRTWPHTDPLSWSQRTATVTLVRRLDQSLAKAVTELEKTDPKYYREFEPLLSWTFWSVPHEWSSTDPSLASSSGRTMECYDETQSDKCMTLGCSAMLKGDMRTSRANLTERQYQGIFCSNMLKGNMDIIQNNFTGRPRTSSSKTVILLCGLAGFSDFLKVDWLQHILRLQDQEVGCFTQPHRRVKRRERMLKDGCSSHITGVSVSALGGYLNYYLTEQDITKRPLT